MSEEEIIKIGWQLEKIANSDTPNDEQASDLLKTLQGLNMSLDTLQKSRIGISVNKLRQKFSGSDTASIAKKLIKTWKRLLPTTSGHSPGQAASHGRTSSHPTPTAQKRKSTERSSNPATPPPVSYTSVSPSSPEQSLSSSQVSDSNTSTSTPVMNSATGSVPNGIERRLSSTSDDFLLVFSNDIDGMSRAHSTNSDVRDRCRDLLAKALKKGFDDVSIEDEIKFYNLAAKIEESIYSSYNDTGMRYKSQVRSRVSNLGDLKNPGLRQAVINGHITPSKVAVMKTDEMASEELKKIRKAITKEAIREAQISTTGGGTKTDLLKCGKCKKRNCTYTQAQTRSADEPMTTFVFCNDCGNRWKFC